MTEKALTRIPFGAEDEATILSMARWMRFIAIVTIVAALLTMFVVLVISVYASLTPLPVRVRWGQGEQVLILREIYLLAAAIVGLAMASVNLYLGFLLYQASEDFERVARTDVADQTLVVAGLDRLRRYFQVFVAVTILVFALALSLAAGFTWAARA